MKDDQRRLQELYAELSIRPGDIYEDCAYHPVLCLGADYRDDEIWGVSLVDGSFPRSCSLLHCGVQKLSIEEAWLAKGRAQPNSTHSQSDPQLRVGLVEPKYNSGR